MSTQRLLCFGSAIVWRGERIIFVPILGEIRGKTTVQRMTAQQVLVQIVSSDDEDLDGQIMVMIVILKTRMGCNE